jgi:PAS domain S-box-containing protein
VSRLEPTPSRPQSDTIELLEVFLGLVPDAAVVVDDEGKIVGANQLAEPVFGYSVDELRGAPVELLIPERFRHQHRYHRISYADTPRARPMGVGLELAGRRRDGTEFPVDISLAPVTGGDRPLVIAAIRDATERRAATAAQAQLAAIVTSSQDAIVSMTVEGRVTSWNPGAERILGYSPAEVADLHVSRVIPPDTSAEFEELLAAVMAGESTTPRDTEWLRHDGTRLHVAVSVSPLRDAAGRLLGFSALLRDITERKQAEAELRRLFAEEQRQERWQAATSEIRLSLLSGTDLHESLAMICRWASDLLDADTAAVVISEDGHLRLAAGSGGSSHLAGLSLSPERSLAGRVVASGRIERVAGLGSDVTIELPGQYAGPVGPAIGVPIVSDRGGSGALVVVRSEGRPEFGPDGDLLAEGLADHAALALELDRARAAHERLLLVGERERIARDLHDLVIQRLFATGIGLQSVLRLVDDPTAVERVTRSVEDLDTTIREIRSTIFALETPGSPVSGLRSEVLQLAGSAGKSLGFEPTVRFDGPVDASVPEDVVPHLRAAVREALSNIGRHAHAKRVEIDLVAVDRNIVLTVTDDGVGMGDTPRESGLAHLRERAEGLGGAFEISSSPAGGTRLEWQVPLTR